MKSVVIGGAGFIGSHMVDLLVEQGHKVWIIDDLSTGRLENVPNRDLLRYDICDMPSLCENFLLDADYVFYFAAKTRIQPSIKNPVEYHKTNVNGLLYVLEILRRNEKLKKFVFSSSSSVYGKQETFPILETAPKMPISPYALQKLIGEQYVRLFAEVYGVPCVVLRYFNVFGERLPRMGAYTLLIGRWMNFLDEGKPLEINGSGDQKRDFTYVGDVVDANYRAAMSGLIFGEPFNVGGGNPISVNEVANIFQSVVKCKRVYLPPINEPYMTYANISLAKSVLGWSPKVRLQDWLPIYIKGEQNEKI